MIRFDRLAAVVAVLAMTAGCSRQPSEAPAAAPAPAPAPLRSGIDAAGFDKAASAGRPLSHVNGAWLAKTEIPARPGVYGAFYRPIDKTQDELRAIVEEAAKAREQGRRLRRSRRSATSTAASWTRRAPTQLGKRRSSPSWPRSMRSTTKADLARHMARMLKLN